MDELAARRDAILRAGFGDMPWYAVRCVFQTSTGAAGRPRAVGPGEFAYEERITIWRAASFDEAIDRAEAEAHEYVEGDSAEELIGLAQAYNLFADPADGAEVFSLIRRSDLNAQDYLARFFDTGGEYSRTVTD
jgi:hypothetical protein